MGVRVEYEVKKLPDSYVTYRDEYAFEQDGDAKDSKGNYRKKMVVKKVEERGGWLIVVRGKPGHSIRVMNADQARALGVSLEPRLINTETGEECNAQGVPLSVVAVVGDGGSDHVETDVDVTRNDDQLDLDLTDPAESAAADAIGKLE